MQFDYQRPWELENLHVDELSSPPIPSHPIPPLLHKKPKPQMRSIINHFCRYTVLYPVRLVKDVDINPGGF